MSTNRCTRCGANLTDGYCEYCGWNCPDAIQDKTLTLSGLLCNLTVTKDTCTFTQKVGSPIIVNNKEIAMITLLQAPVIGSGELSIQTVTGGVQKITFLYLQNQNMEEIASYLLHVAPEAQIVRATSATATAAAPAAIGSVVCPKCRSNNTTTSGESRKFSVWKIVVGGLLISMGIGTSPTDIIIFLLLFLGGAALVANGLRLFGKKKLNCICMNCRKRFRV